VRQGIRSSLQFVLGHGPILRTPPRHSAE
jgi:hypothetical protein